MTRKRRSIKKRFRIIFEFVGIIMLWRGIWGIMDLFLFPGNDLTSYSASILLGATFIFLDGDGISDLSR